MSAPASRLSALRQLLSERFPQAARPTTAALPTGISQIDDSSGGGLPRHALTELVCAASSCGSQLFIGQLLHAVRVHGGRVVLIDASDSFDPASSPPDDLRCLIWLRCGQTTEAMAVADLFARDANLALILLDLRCVAPAELRRIPARTWYRLQRAIEQTDAAFLVLTPTASVPSAQLRLTLDRSLASTALASPRPDLTATLTFSLQRQRLSRTQAVES